MVIFTKKFRTLDPNLPIVLKKNVFFDTFPNAKKSLFKCVLFFLYQFCYLVASSEKKLWRNTSTVAGRLFLNKQHQTKAMLNHLRILGHSRRTGGKS